MAFWKPKNIARPFRFALDASLDASDKDPSNLAVSEMVQLVLDNQQVASNSDKAWRLSEGRANVRSHLLNSQPTTRLIWPWVVANFFPTKSGLGYVLEVQEQRLMNRTMRTVWYHELSARTLMEEMGMKPEA